MKTNLLKDALFAFVSGFIAPTLKLKRRVHFPGIRRRETLAEHVIQLLYASEFIIKHYNLNLDIHKVRSYILGHDMSEPFTPHARKNGFDICKFRDKNLVANKKEIENNALICLLRQFPELEDLGQASLDYDEHKDDEANFVKALDALLPLVNVTIDEGRTHKIDRITLEAWREDREKKVKLDPTLSLYYFDFLLPLLQENEEELFHQDKRQGELDFK